MRKIIKLILTAALSVSLCFFSSYTGYAKAENNFLYLGGIPAGFTIKTKGATVIGLSDIVTKDGVFSPSKNADIRIGDVIISINECEIDGSKSVSNILQKNGNTPVKAVIDRNGEQIVKYIQAKRDSEGIYKLGLFLRDDLSGIGTVTYFTKKGEFGALGHPISDDGGKILSFTSGKAFLCSVVDVVKGEKGKAGELKGFFMEDTVIGKIEANKPTGLYGVVNGNYKFENLPKTEIGEANMGKATITTCIDGVTPKEYQISIIKIDKNNKENKNFVIKILDKKLLSVTNGILQGMSGSPIMQGGKIIGAVTHVFLNDPSRGFGISIENMLKAD